MISQNIAMKDMSDELICSGNVAYYAEEESGKKAIEFPLGDVVTQAIGSAYCQGRKQCQLSRMLII